MLVSNLKFRKLVNLALKTSFQSSLFPPLLSHNIFPLPLLIETLPDSQIIQQKKVEEIKKCNPFRSIEGYKYALHNGQYLKINEHEG